MNKLWAFVREHRAGLAVTALVLLQRLAALWILGPEYYIASDDGAYVSAGVVFAQTGTITIHEQISAQIMPGMPVLIGLVYRLVGDGTPLWLTLKLLWIAMGTLSAWMVYKNVTVFAPKWCGAAAAALLLAPDLCWTDSLILTETPFILCLLTMLYGTLMMGKTQKGRYYGLTLVSYMAALMLKANIGLFPVFAALYLLVKKYPFRRLLKQGIALGCVMLCFLIPWTIRNYQLFDAFIPLTYGAGNPRLLGTYQGFGFPEDGALDYETHVDRAAAEAHARYYAPDGSLKQPHHAQYLALERDGIKAEYRLRVWWQENPLSLLFSYLVYKPAAMTVGVFYWDTLFGVGKAPLYLLRLLELAVCAAATLLALQHKRLRAEAGFMNLLYWFHLYLYAATFSYSRYALTLLPMRLVLLGWGLHLIHTACIERRGRRDGKTESSAGR